MAADQADAARKKVPKKKKPVKQRTVDPATGKAKTRLRFEEVDKPAPVSKLTHAVQAAPVHAAAGTVHRKISETEHDNVGVESAHRLEETAAGRVWRRTLAVPKSCAPTGRRQKQNENWNRQM